MSDSPSGGLTRLVARASDPATEIFLIDAGFQRIGQGVGQLAQDVPPGLYKLRRVAGAVSEDLLVEVAVLPAGEVLTVELSPLAINSAVPLEGTRVPHRVQSSRAAELSRAPAEKLGEGSNLFLLVRDPDPEADRPVETEPWLGVSVSDTYGRLVADLSRSPLTRQADSVGALHIELDPGTYVVSVDTRVWGIQEMAVTTCRGWQTQVFLCARPLGRHHGEAKASGRRMVRRADLFTASVAMADPKAGFDPGSVDARLSELGRQALERGRNIVRSGELREALLRGKFQDPMLGLYGAHLLLLEQPLARDVLAEVVGNLERLGLASHPDLAAIALALGQQPAPGLLGAPPSLRSSWHRIVDATVDDPTLVPYRSLAALIGPQVIGSGCWLTWRRPGPGEQRRLARRSRLGDKAPRRSVAVAVEVLLGELGKQQRHEAEPMPPAHGAEAFAVDPSRMLFTVREEEWVPKVLPHPPNSISKPGTARPAKQHPWSALEMAALGVLKSTFSGRKPSPTEALRELTRQLGLPAASLEPVIEGVLKKAGWG